MIEYDVSPPSDKHWPNADKHYLARSVILQGICIWTTPEAEITGPFSYQAGKIINTEVESGGQRDKNQLKVHSNQEEISQRDVNQMLVYCWAHVVDVGPTIN